MKRLRISYASIVNNLIRTQEKIKEPLPLSKYINIIEDQKGLVLDRQKIKSILIQKNHHKSIVVITENGYAKSIDVIV